MTHYRDASNYDAAQRLNVIAGLFAKAMLRARIFGDSQSFCEGGTGDANWEFSAKALQSRRKHRSVSKAVNSPKRPD